MLVFSEQNVIKDPPFSKLDLISCRNLMIYLGGELQKRIIPLFHYSLRSGGFLFLGVSETVGEFTDIFSTQDSKSKIYRRKEDFVGVYHVAPGLLLSPSTDERRPQTSRKAMGKGRESLRDLAEQELLAAVAPTGALINSHGDIFYLHGRTGRFLEPAPGDAGVSNILKMAREGLKRELTTALRKAVGTKGPVQHPGLRVKTNGDFTMVNLIIKPVASAQGDKSAQELFLVIFDETQALEQEPPAVAADDSHDSATDTDQRIAALMLELRSKEENIQTATEQLQTSNEELRSANEEMQSVNEEMQSTNEELETSKEELQSVNEELSTINNELQTRVADLARVNNDMNNLLAGTGIGTVFVDTQLRILRFTPTATSIINLIQSDIGRPVGHIVSNLPGYDSLVADAQAVLDNLIPKELEVRTLKGDWYTMRILPYRTIGNVIEGVVITFVDINEVKKAQEALREGESLRRLAVVVRDAHDAITVQNSEGRIIAWNPGAERIYGWNEAEALRMNRRDMIPECLREEALERVKKLSVADVLEPYRTQRITKDGRILEVWVTATALVNETGQLYAIATTERESGLGSES